jgi:CubicO group peptidase (beta-lactamase class C family)
MRLSVATLLLSSIIASVPVVGGVDAQPTGRATTAGSEVSKTAAPAVAIVESRIARVEQGLLPPLVIAGRPLPRSALADRMAALKTPGVSIAVINGGAVEWARGYGVIDAGSASAVTPHTLFQAASISKSVAAAGAMKLVEQGLLSLDTPVNEKLTSWKVPDNDVTKEQKVTLRRLLNHSAGLTVHGFGGYPAGTPVPTVVQVLDGAPPANSAAVRPDIVPGSRWRYSGGGYTVVQQLLTDVTGKAFPALLADLVLGPAGMRDSTYEQPLPEPRRGLAASGHLADGTSIPGRFHTYPEIAAAGLWTTPSDLASFLVGIQRALNGKPAFLKPETARLMVTNLSGGYGLGLSLDGVGAAASFGHGGSNAGFKCSMTAFVEGGRGAVVMTNGDQGGRLADEILRAIAREYGWPTYRPREKTVVPVDRASLAALQGRYELRPGRTLVVSLENDGLVVLDGPQRVELFPESPTRFFDLLEGHTLDFFIERGAATPSHMVVDGQIKAQRRVE